MSTTAATEWNALDPSTREQLDRQFLEELTQWGERGLTDEAVRVYLDYRHARPGQAITTYEEGQIKRLLRRLPHVDLPDPVDQEEHLDWLERYGASHWHATNDQTYLIVMVALTFAFLLTIGAIAWVAWL